MSLSHSFVSLDFQIFLVSRVRMALLLSTLGSHLFPASIVCCVYHQAISSSVISSAEPLLFCWFLWGGEEESSGPVCPRCRFGWGARWWESGLLLLVSGPTVSGVPKLLCSSCLLCSPLFQIVVMCSSTAPVLAELPFKPPACPSPCSQNAGIKAGWFVYKVQPNGLRVMALGNLPRDRRVSS